MIWGDLNGHYCSHSPVQLRSGPSLPPDTNLAHSHTHTHTHTRAPWWLPNLQSSGWSRESATLTSSYLRCIHDFSPGSDAASHAPSENRQKRCTDFNKEPRLNHRRQSGWLDPRGQYPERGQLSARGFSSE